MPKYRKSFVRKPCGCVMHWHGTKSWTDRCVVHGTAVLPFGGVHSEGQSTNVAAGPYALREAPRSLAHEIVIVNPEVR